MCIKCALRPVAWCTFTPGIYASRTGWLCSYQHFCTIAAQDMMIIFHDLWHHHVNSDFTKGLIESNVITQLMHMLLSVPFRTSFGNRMACFSILNLLTSFLSVLLSRVRIIHVIWVLAILVRYVLRSVHHLDTHVLVQKAYKETIVMVRLYLDSNIPERGFKLKSFKTVETVWNLWIQSLKRYPNLHWVTNIAPRKLLWVYQCLRGFAVV